MSTARRHLDQYFTPASATQELLRHITLGGRVLECCNGDGAISNVLAPFAHGLHTNDIDPLMSADYHLDATLPSSWQQMGQFDWIISNPPFNQAADIIPMAYPGARIGIAMLLRLSYLEPCHNRARWLAAYPPTKLIVLPRISFTGDGKTDNVTCAWMVWEKAATTQQIIVVPR